MLFSDILSSINFEINYLQQARYIFVITITIIHILYFIAFLGIFSVNDDYIHYLNIFIQAFVVLFLIIRFHPYKNGFSITPSDRTIVFGGAMLLATNLLTVEFSNWIPYEFGKKMASQIREYMLIPLGIVKSGRMAYLRSDERM
jgi:hypothetical protein